MKKVKKRGVVLSKTSLEFEAKRSPEPLIVHQFNSTSMQNRKESKERKNQFKGPLSHVEQREKRFTDPEFDLESPVEEMHWMAFAAYNQTNQDLIR